MPPIFKANHKVASNDAFRFTLLSSQMDNHGYRLTVPDEDVVNKPAVAAAQVIRRHVAQDSDEITLEVSGIHLLVFDHLLLYQLTRRRKPLFVLAVAG